MTDVIFSSRLWLKVPTAFENVPRSQIIAHSLSSLRPPDRLFEAFMSQVARLVDRGAISEEAGIRARLGALTTSTLVLETNGRISTLDEGTSLSIVAEILEREQEDRERAIEEATTTERQRAAAEVSAIDQNLKQALDRITILEEKFDEARSKRDAVAKATAKIITKAAFLLGIFVIILFVFMSLLDIFELSAPHTRSIEVGLAVVFTILAYFGITFFDLCRRAESWVESEVGNLLERWLSVDLTHNDQWVERFVTKVSRPCRLSAASL
jgi:hypothetical protein